MILFYVIIRIISIQKIKSMVHIFNAFDYIVIFSNRLLIVSIEKLM